MPWPVCMLYCHVHVILNVHVNSLSSSRLLLTSGCISAWSDKWLWVFWWPWWRRWRRSHRHRRVWCCLDVWCTLYVYSVCVCTYICVRRNMHARPSVLSLFSCPSPPFPPSPHSRSFKSPPPPCPLACHASTVCHWTKQWYGAPPTALCPVDLRWRGKWGRGLGGVICLDGGSSLARAPHGVYFYFMYILCIEYYIILQVLIWVVHYYC